ncbi:MAG: CBS domain-containing protein [Gammaproteobacteria bacterium]
MSKSVTLTRPDARLTEAARRMAEEDVGALPIGEDDRLVGMLTDRDIVIRAVARNRPAAETTVRDAMSEGIRYCMETDAVEKAADIMAREQVRRLPVINSNKRLVGIVSLGDLATEGPSESAEEALAGVSREAS